MARTRRYRVIRPSTVAATSTIEVGRSVDGYRLERVVADRPGLHMLVDARVPGGERVLLDFVATPLPRDRELRRRMGRLLPHRKSLDHPNVLRLLKVVDGGQRLHLKPLPPEAMTLAERLRRGALGPETALRLLGQVAGALDTAREKGLVHRALSPNAVFVLEGDEPRALLTDFGICAPRGPGCELRVAVDEAAYRSPEEVRGEAPEPASNVYSLACMLVECLTGTPPFPHRRPVLVMHAHLSAAPPRLSDRDPAMPAALDSVVATAMAKDPRKRQPSAEAFVRSVAEALGVSVPIPVVRAPKRKPAPERPPAHQRPPARAQSQRPARATGPARPARPPRPERRPETKPVAATPPARSRDHGGRTRRRRASTPRLAPALAGLALLASAAAGFAGGSLGGGDSPVAERPTRVAATGPAAATRHVDRTVERLDVRRVAARRQLREAGHPKGQARAATALAGAYADARARVAGNGSAGPAEAELVDRLERIEAAYDDMAAAARGGSARRWTAAGAAAQERESDLELLLRNRDWN